MKYVSDKTPTNLWWLCFITTNPQNPQLTTPKTGDPHPYIMQPQISGLYYINP